MTQVDLTLLNHRLGDLHHDVSEMKSALKDLATAITKLALIEERQSNAAAAQERAFKVLESLESRVSRLEVQAPASKRANIWVDRATWSCVGLVAMYVAKKAGLL